MPNAGVDAIHTVNFALRYSGAGSIGDIDSRCTVGICARFSAVAGNLYICNRDISCFDTKAARYILAAYSTVGRRHSYSTRSTAAICRQRTPRTLTGYISSVARIRPPTSSKI